MYHPQGETKIWTPTVIQSRTDVYQSSRRHHDNPSPEPRTALRELREMVTKRIVRISPADKGGAVVVQDAANYVSEANRQLQDERHYSNLKKDPTVQIAKTSNEPVNRLHIDGHIDNITCRWALVEPNNVRFHQFHLLPKIQKTLTNPPGRPIVSCVNGPTDSLSKLVTTGCRATSPAVQLHRTHHSYATYAPALEPGL